MELAQGHRIECIEQWVQIDSQRKKYVYQWMADSPTIGSICIVHGLGEHGGRYRRLASFFAESGFRVVAFDQQGHGRSPEPRGCIRSYQSLLDDLAAVSAWTQAQQPAAPHFLFGHSMGGNLVVNLALRRPPEDLGVRGIIASSPMFRAVREPTWPVRAILRCLLLVAPNFTLQSRVIPERLMDDPIEIDEWNADPLFHSTLSLRLGAALIDSGRWALKHAHRLSTPMLITHGTNDVLTRYDASVEFARAAGALCQLEIVPGALHDPFRCRDRHRVLQRYQQFLTELAGATKGTATGTARRER